MQVAVDAAGLMKLLSLLKSSIHGLGRRSGEAIVGTVAFNMKPVKGPWGGSSPFVAQLANYLEWRGYSVVYALDERVDLAVLIDPRTETANRVFGVPDLVRARDANPKLRVLHRINECDQRKGTAFMDEMLKDANLVADYTVFISEWLRTYHAERWFDTSRPNSVIYNGADPRIFHPVGSGHWDGVAPLRIVTHHWSNHPLKGFAEYQALDDAIADGKISGVELVVIGRWPESIRWKSAITMPPMHGKALAEQLKRCHLYVTASRWEPCGMHHVEGAQCGLPLLYHEDGGGIVEAGRKYGIGFRNDLVSIVEQAKQGYASLRQNVLSHAPSGDRMCIAFADIIQQLVAEDRK